MSSSEGPGSIALDKENNIYISDEVNRRVIKYSNDGKYLGTIILEQKKIKRKTINPIYLFAKKNPKVFEETYGKSYLNDKPEYIEKEIDATPYGGEISIDKQGNIYCLSSQDLSGSYSLVVYNNNGKIIRAYTKKELIGEDTMNDFNLINLNIDDKGYIHINAYRMANEFKIAYGVEIDQLGKAKKIDWEKLDNETKTKKYGYGSIQERKRKIQNFSLTSSKLEKMVKQYRKKDYAINPIVDTNGNIYELIWDDKNLNEGIKIIKWEKRI